MSKDGQTEERRGWPDYLPGGRVRTSTAALLLAFVVVWWVQQTFEPEPKPPEQPAQVVPPGFLPDPNYTWVPRTQVRERPTYQQTYPPTTTATTTTTTSPTETTSPTSTPESPTSPTSPTTPTSPGETPATTISVPPGPGPTPTTPPPAG